MAIDDQEFDFVAQNAHMCGGALFVLVPQFLFGGLAWAVGMLLLLAFAAVKEFWWDYRFETAEVRGSSWSDFLHYAAGGSMAIGLVALRALPLFSGK